jgi:hypothetical protein
MGLPKHVLKEGKNKLKIICFFSRSTAGRISYLYTYDLYRPVHNVFDACRSITRASRRGLGPGNRELLGPVKWLQADRRVPFGTKLEISRSQPVPICQSNGSAGIKNITHGDV